MDGGTNEFTERAASAFFVVVLGSMLDLEELADAAVDGRGVVVVVVVRRDEMK